MIKSISLMKIITFIQVCLLCISTYLASNNSKDFPSHYPKAISSMYSNKRDLLPSDGFEKMNQISRKYFAAKAQGKSINSNTIREIYGVKVPDVINN